MTLFFKKVTRNTILAVQILLYIYCYQTSQINSQSESSFFKVRLHTAINRADFVSWCMLYTKEGNKCVREKMTLCFRG